MLYINNTKFNVGFYPVGEQLLELSNDNIESLKYNDFINIRWHYENDSEFMTLWFLTKKLKELYPSKTLNRLNIPYFPYARMDRIKKDSQFFSLKYTADFINDLGFARVIVYDAHSDVLLDLVKNVENRSFIEGIVEDIIHDNNLEYKDCLICFPDKTALKRYGNLKSMFFGSIYIEKTRDFDTGKITGFELSVLDGDKSYFEGKSVIIVDDICSYGGTFIGAIEEIKKYFNNEDFYLAVAHLEDSFNLGNLKNHPNLKDYNYSSSLGIHHHTDQTGE